MKITSYRYRRLAGMLLLVIALSACRLFTAAPPASTPAAPSSALSETSAPALTSASPTQSPTGRTPTRQLAATQTVTEPTIPTTGPTETQTAQPTSGAGPGKAEPADPAFCEYNPTMAGLLEQTTAESWLDWVEKLSGAEPVIIGGEETTIKTRFSVSMFDGSPHARAFEYVREQALSWYPQEQVTEMEYTVTNPSDSREYRWKNLIITIPGQTSPEEVVILSAHLDSMSEIPELEAPGAEDNGSGSAALLEAARVLKDTRFERTVQIIWFTGEELGLHGSRAFVERIENPDSVVGVVNLDMFGYDSDSDRCFEMHVGTMAESDQVGRCFTGAIEAYNLDLPNYDYLESQATDRSDHGSFWRSGIGAIEILENMFDNNLTASGQPNACSNGDVNPNYHTPRDLASALNGESGVQIVRAAIATIAAMAHPVE